MQQQGLLCAQHCLNTLLQSEIFTAVELAEIAKNLDEDEARRFAEGGESSEHYKKFKEVTNLVSILYIASKFNLNPV